MNDNKNGKYPARSLIVLDASRVFGEGSTITWLRLNYGERQAKLEQFNEMRSDLEKYKRWLNDMVFEHLVAWSLEMPVPTNDEELYQLYDNEIEFLYRTMNQTLTGNLLVTSEAIKN